MRIRSVHNKERLTDTNIDKVLHLSNISALKLLFLFIYEHSKPEQCWILSQYIILEV